MKWQETEIQRERRLRKQRAYLNAYRARKRGAKVGAVIQEELPGIDHLYRDPPRGFDCDPSVWPLLSMGFWGFHIEFVEVHA